MFHRTFTVKQHQRGLLYRNGDFVKSLTPGEYRYFDPFRTCKLELINLREPWFEHRDLDVLMQKGELKDCVQYIDCKENWRAFVFFNGRFVRSLKPGRYAVTTPYNGVVVLYIDLRKPFDTHTLLRDVMHDEEVTQNGQVLELKDHERALVWVNGRFEKALGPGLHAVWNKYNTVRIEVLDARGVRFDHPELLTMIQSPGVAQTLLTFTVEPGQVGLLFQDGKFREELQSGTHAFWAGIGKLKLFAVDLKEQMIDIQGQEIMTADKVTLRLNAVLAYKVVDPLKAITEIDDAKQALYREAQLAMRQAVGQQELDQLLADKEALAEKMQAMLIQAAPRYGLELRQFGVRDIILPGEMKEILNRVMQAKKQAEAGLITRREETAAARMQANTAKILEQNPTLMKLRELEVLEKVAEKANLTVVLGEGQAQGLKDKVVKLL